MPNPLLTLQKNHQWQNKHRNVSLLVDSFYDVYNLWCDAPAPEHNDWRPGLQGLRSVVAEAERQSKRVRALGGAWSLSEAAITADVMVNTKSLNFIELGFRSANIAPEFTGDRSRLCFAQCGASVMELYSFLESRGFTLPTSGASNGQTIAGAVATGTHGSANSVGSMQDFIIGLHLVLDGGRQVWVERATQPVVSEAFCQIIGAELVRDDGMFNAAVVAFGSFGLIHAVLFEAVPIFLLEKRLARFDYSVVRPVLSTLDVSLLGLPELTELPFHFEIVIDPYHVKDGQRGAYVRALSKRPFAPVVPSSGSSSGIVQGDDAMGLLGAVTNPAPGIVPLIIEHVLSLQLKPVQGVLGTPGQQFGPTDTRGFIMSTEIGVALADAENAVDAIVHVAHEFPWGGFPAIRYVKGSSALLPFTHFAPVACTIEIPSAGSNRTKQAFERVWVELHRRNVVFTLHWGQCLRPSAIHFPSAYGARVNDWLTARARLLGPSGMQLFSSDWLDQLGLNNAAPNGELDTARSVCGVTET
ncbi:MAG TPA: FAD-binding protein [Polyangiaceae bacterium]